MWHVYHGSIRHLSFPPYSHYGEQYRDSLKNKQTKKLGIKLPYYPEILLLVIYFEETITEKDTFILTFIATLFTIFRAWKQPRYASTDEWIRKLWYIYTMEYYWAIKRNGCESVELRWMSPEPVIQSEVSQKEKNKYHVLMLRYGI